MEQLLVTVVFQDIDVLLTIVPYIVCHVVRPVQISVPQIGDGVWNHFGILLTNFCKLQTLPAVRSAVESPEELGIIEGSSDPS